MMNLFVSRSVLFASLCFVVLLGAVGSSSYVAISGLRSQVDSLQETVSSLEEERDALQNNVTELQEEIVHLQNEISHMNSTKTFVFEFPPWQQTIVNGTLRMELTFSWNQENLSIIAKINDDEYSYMDYLGLVFDFDGDGILERTMGTKLFADNTTLSNYAWLQDNGFLSDPTIGFPISSPFHTCVFQPSVGYTFNISIPFSLLGTPSDLIHICFYDYSCDNGACMCFHFGMSVS